MEYFAFQHQGRRGFITALILKQIKIEPHNENDLLSTINDNIEQNSNYNVSKDLIRLNPQVDENDLEEE